MVIQYEFIGGAAQAAGATLKQIDAAEVSGPIPVRESLLRLERHLKGAEPVFFDGKSLKKYLLVFLRHTGGAAAGKWNVAKINAAHISDRARERILGQNMLDILGRVTRVGGASE